MRLRLQFEGEVKPEALGALVAAWVEVLQQKPAALETTRTETLYDPNSSTSSAHDTTWAAPGVTLHVRTQVGEGGNPRDGWGYDTKVELDLELGGGRKVAMRAGEGSYSPWLSNLGADFYEVSLAEFDALREATRQQLGEARDRTDAPFPAFQNIDTARAAGELDAAKTLLARCFDAHAEKDHTADSWAWSHVLAHRNDLLGEGPEVLAKQLRDDPAASSTWRKVASGERTAPPFGADDARRVLARLEPQSTAAVDALCDLQSSSVTRPLLAAAFAHPRWVPPSPADAELLASPRWREAIDAARGSWFTIVPARFHATDASLFASWFPQPLGQLVDGRAARHFARGDLALGSRQPGRYYPRFGADPGTWSSEWQAVWKGDGAPAVETTYRANCDDTLWQWTWLWWPGDAPRALVIAEARTFSPEKSRDSIDPKDWQKRDERWVHLGAQFCLLGDDAWRTQSFAKLRDRPDRELRLVEASAR